MTVADRTFEEVGDAEGKANVTNEDGVSVNGDDDGGLHRFSPDGSAVVYGDYGTGGGPHFTRVIGLRNTVTGRVQWSAEVDRPFNFLAHTGDRVLVGQPREEHGFEPSGSTESVVVLDACTGEETAKVPVTTRILYAGP